MRVVLDTTPKKYIDDMRTRLDSRWIFGTERYVGWTIGNLFSISYYSGNEFGRRNYPIANKAIGIVKGAGDKTEVCYRSFQGLTDPISLAVLFVLTLWIFAVVGVPGSVWFAFAWVAAVAAMTWVCTRLSAVGQEGSKRIGEFLRYME